MMTRYIFFHLKLCSRIQHFMQRVLKRGLAGNKRSMQLIKYIKYDPSKSRVFAELFGPNTGSSFELWHISTAGCKVWGPIKMSLLLIYSLRTGRRPSPLRTTVHVNHLCLTSSSRSPLNKHKVLFPD